MTDRLSINELPAGMTTRPVLTHWNSCKEFEKHSLFSISAAQAHRLKGIHDLSCVMLSNIARMIITIITSFNNMAQIVQHWTTYFEGPSGLAWDLSQAPKKEILMGLYARCIFLPSHWLVFSAGSSALSPMDVQRDDPFGKGNETRSTPRSCPQRRSLESASIS